MFDDINWDELDFDGMALELGVTFAFRKFVNDLINKHNVSGATLINALTAIGEFYDQGGSTDLLFKRLQVHPEVVVDEGIELVGGGETE